MSASLDFLFFIATASGQYHLNRRDCKGRGPLPGFGVSPKNLFSFFLLAAAGGKEKKKEKLGTPQTPAGRPLHPFYDVFKWYWPQAANCAAKKKEHVLATEKSGMTHKHPCLQSKMVRLPVNP